MREVVMEHLARLEEIVQFELPHKEAIADGGDVKGLNIEYDVQLESVGDAELQRAGLVQQREQLDALKEEVTRAIGSVRAEFQARRRGENGGSESEPLYEKFIPMPSDDASDEIPDRIAQAAAAARDEIALLEEAAIRPLRTVVQLINELISGLDNARGKIDEWMLTQAREQ